MDLARRAKTGDLDDNFTGCHGGGVLGHGAFLWGTFAALTTHKWWSWSGLDSSEWREENSGGLAMKNRMPANFAAARIRS